MRFLGLENSVFYHTKARSPQGRLRERVCRLKFRVSCVFEEAGELFYHMLVCINFKY